MEESFYYLGFSYFSGIGPSKMRLLLEKFGSCKNAWESKDVDTENILGKIIGERFIFFRKNFNFKNVIEDLSKKEIKFLTLNDSQYPQLLKTIKNPPFILYVKGNLELLNNNKTIAIVGTRRVTQYGKQITELITTELVENGFVTVSGLAFGVDAICHTATLDTKGKTIAVLGCGVDCCTPRENQQIYNEILKKNGAIISTFLPGKSAIKGSFPARNKTVAGLSLGVVVTEGASDSGALITAEYAKEFKRLVFAIPGPITSSFSRAPNSLLQNGAIMITSGADIIKAFSVENTIPSSSILLGTKVDSNDKQFSKEEESIVNILVSESLHFDDIVRTIGKSAKEVGVLLSLMEIKGMVKNNGGIYNL